jgi:hypothetical protein
MTQADSVLSTPPANMPTTRRRFLSASAGLAAGAALAGAPAPVSATNDDPAFRLIEKHRVLEAALEATIHEKSRIESLRQKFDDDLAHAAHHAEKSALLDLIYSVPTTLAGVIASMTYIAGLPDLDWGRIEDDLIGPLLSNLAVALEGLAAVS